MVLYEAAANGVAATTGAAIAELEPNGTRRLYVREIGVFNQAATALSKGQIGRPANTPTGGSLITGQAYDPSNAAATGGWTVTWTTAPTAPATPMKQFDFGAVIGSAVIYAYEPDAPLVVGPTRANSILVWNAGAGTAGATSVSAKWIE